MSNCGFTLKLNNQQYHFEDQDELKQFVTNNFYRIKQADGIINIPFSLDHSPFLESQSKIQKMIEESEQIKIEFDQNGDKVVQSEKFKGVSRILEEAKGDNGFLVSHYDEANYIKNATPLVIAELQSDPQNEGKTQDELKIMASDLLNRKVLEMRQLGKFGTYLHSVSDFYFKNGMTDINDVMNGLKEKYPDVTFKEDVVSKMLDKVKEIGNKIYKIHGDDAKIYTEIPVYDTDTHIMGIIDLLVLDNKGKTHIYDYKTSHKKAYSWAKVKMNHMTYQMAFYNQLLLKKGLITNSINLIPIDLSDLDYETHVINDIDTSQPLMNITNDISKTYIQYEVNKILPVSLSQFINKEVSSSNVKEELEKSFGYAIQTDVDSNGLKIRTDNKGNKYFLNRLTGRNQYLNGTDEENQLAIDKYKQEYAVNENNEISRMKGYIKQYKIDGAKFVEELRLTDAQKTAFEKMFAPYKDIDWELMDDEGLDSLGIIAFQNTMTKTIDFISLTSNKIDSKVKLTKGKTILGNYQADRVLFKEKGLLEATTTNIEGLKIAMWINSHMDQLNSFDCSIGDMRVATTDLYNVKGVNSKDIIKNYERLTRETGVTFNIKNIRYSNPYDLLLQKVLSVFNSEESMNQLGSAKWNVVKNIAGKLEDQSIGKSFYVNLSTEQINDKIRTLIELQSMIKRQVEQREIDPTDDLSFINYLINSSLTYYNNLEITYVDDIKGAALNESAQFSSIQNIKNKSVKMMDEVFSKAKATIASRFNSVNDDINSYLTKYFKSQNFNMPSQLLLGKALDIYEDLWERGSDGKITDDFKLRNPDHDNSLTEPQKSFIRNILETFAKYRYDSDQKIADAKLSGDYYKVPLMKASGIGRLKQKGVISTVKSSIENSVNMMNFFKDEEEENRNRTKAMDSVYNQFDAQKDSKRREEMIKELGVNEFEHDLQTIVKLYALRHITQEHFSKVLPVINAIKNVTAFKNAGMATQTVEHLNKFIEDYIKVNIFNQKLIDKNQETFVKSVNVMKNITSFGLLSFNFAAGIRDFLQGFMTNSVLVAAKQMGIDLKKEYILKSYGLLIKSSPDSLKNIELFDSLNAEYGVSMMDTKMLADRAAIGQNGLFTFRGEQLYWANSIADRYNRMSLFVARMLQDGSFKAHSIIDGKLVYNWKKDKRFNVYSKGPTYSNDPEYNKQRGLYLTLIREFNNQSLTEVPLKEGDALPQAYTYHDIKVIKDFSNLIFGYYDQDSRSMFQQTWFGVAFMQFRPWLKAKLDQMVLKRGEYTIGTRKQGEENGQLLWFKRNEDGTEEITTENTGIPYYPMTESTMEGMLISFGRFFSNIYQSKSLGEAIKLLKEDDLMKGNLASLCGNTAVFAILSLLLATVDWPELKKDKPFLSRVLWTVSQADADMFIGNNLAQIIDPQSMIPSMSYLYKTSGDVAKLMIGQKHLSSVMTDFGITRPFSGYFAETD